MTFPRQVPHIPRHSETHELREDAPEMRRLLTTSYSAELPSINLWVPPLNCLEMTNTACTRTVPRTRYQNLWWYHACVSHACGPYPPSVSAERSPERVMRSHADGGTIPSLLGRGLTAINPAA